MGVRQWIAVALTVLLNALDGFDVLSIGRAGAALSPVLAGGSFAARMPR